MELDYKIIPKKRLTILEEEVKALKSQLQEATQFIQEIEKGNTKIEVSEEIARKELGISLHSMRNHLIRIAAEENERNWINSGLAKFVEILRNTQSLDFKSLTDNILLHLVKYIDANQGAIFVLEDEIATDIHLEMVACYAYDRKKYMNMRIDIGEGLVGQCVLEREQILLTEIPPNYVHITSGLGGTTPKSILISPLMLNDKVFGVIEIASFNKFQSYQIEFINRLSESIASSIRNIKETEKTQDLLNASQQQAEELRAAEEEMRQNMEEMQTTQEEMLRKNLEIEKASAEAASMLSGINATMATIEFAPNGTIIKANENFLKSVKYTPDEVRGKHHKMFVPAEVLKDEAGYKAFWDKLASGDSHTGIFKRMDSKGKPVWLNSVYTPIFDHSGKVVRIMAFASDITLEREREEKIKNTLEMAKAQEEYMLIMNKEMEEKNFELQVREDVFAVASILSEADLKGNITYANRKLVEVSKYGLNELIGKPHNIFRHPDMPKEFFKLFWDTIQSGKTFKGIIKNKAKDGTTYWVDGSFVPIKDGNGKIIKYVGARYHITNEKIAIAMYNEQAQQLGLPTLAE
ncbi:MAG TPA: PAS domain-containing protein [Cytophagales bacterium]|nr:PAS domain-containing protein [Cytophagales bacterium]